MPDNIVYNDSNAMTTRDSATGALPIAVVMICVIMAVASADAQDSSTEPRQRILDLDSYDGTVRKYPEKRPETARKPEDFGTGVPYEALRENIVVYSQSSRKAREAGAGRWEAEVIDPATARTAFTLGAMSTADEGEGRNYALFNLLIGIVAMGIGALVTLVLLHALGEMDRLF